jgi:hypothetical protein
MMAGGFPGRPRRPKWELVVGLCGVVLACAVSVAWPASEFSLVSQGWRFVEREGQRSIEMSALVTNQSKSPLEYEVRFVVEREEGGPAGKTGGGEVAAGAPGTEPLWTVVKTVTMRGGPLAPGASEVVKGLVSHEVLEAGKTFRFRAELISRATSALLAAATITSGPAAAGAGAAAAAGAGVSAGGALAAAGAVLAATGALGGGGGGAGPAAAVSGSGTMVGTHESHRVSGEWVEHGSGQIDVTGPRGHLVLDYVYDAHGPSASDLTATATATGTFTPVSGAAQSAQITSASAHITQAGDRQQVGQVITRSGGQATGTFSGTVGGEAWTGVLQMTDGVMTLDLSSDTGSHRFNIQFTTSR